MVKNVYDFLPWMPIILNGLVLLVVAIRRPAHLRRYVVLSMAIQTVIFFLGEFLGYVSARHDQLLKYSYPPFSYDFLRNTLGNVTTLVSGWVAAAILGLILNLLLFRRGQELFITRREFWLLVLGAVCVGWPAILIYLATIFVLSVVGMIGLILMKKKTLQDRLVIAPFIIPATLITFLTGQYTLVLTHLNKISF